MDLDRRIFDDSWLTNVIGNWKTSFLVGEDLEAEVDPAVVGAQYLLFDLQRLAAIGNVHADFFTEFRNNLEQLAETRPYRIDVDRFIDEVQRQVTSIIPAMGEELEGLPINSWLSVYVRLVHIVPQQLLVRLKTIGENDECLGGFVVPVSGAKTVSGRIGAFTGRFKSPSREAVAGALASVLQQTASFQQVSQSSVRRTPSIGL